MTLSAGLLLGLAFVFVPSIAIHLPTPRSAGSRFIEAPGPIAGLPREEAIGGDTAYEAQAAVARIADVAAVNVIDGDTFRYRGENIRIADIDAPETHPARCAAEAELGARATRRLSQLLAAGPFDLLPIDRDRDRYGRQLRIVARDGFSIGDTLVAEGLARGWIGRRTPWC